MGRILALALCLPLLPGANCRNNAKDDATRPRAQPPCEVAGRLVELARDYYIRKRYPQALQELTRALEKCPHHGEALEVAGHVYLAMGRLDDAEQYFRRLLDLRLGRDQQYLATEARLNLAAVDMQRERWANALKWLGEAEKDVLYDYPYLIDYNMGVCHERLNDRVKARLYYQKAVEKYEDMCVAWFRLAEMDMSDGNMELACLNYERSIRKNPSPARDCSRFVDGHYKLGLCEMRRKRYSEAVAPLQACVRLAGDQPPARDCAGLLKHLGAPVPEKEKPSRTDRPKQIDDGSTPDFDRPPPMPK